MSILNRPGLAGIVASLSGAHASPLQAQARAQDKFNLDVSTAIAPAVSPVVWTTLMPINSWALFGASTTSPGYYQDAVGRVWLKGKIGGGTTGVSLFSATLPVPGVTWTLPCMTNTGAGLVTIGTNGQAVLVSGGTTWISLDSLSYVP